MQDIKRFIPGQIYMGLLQVPLVWNPVAALPGSHPPIPSLEVGRIGSYQIYASKDHTSCSNAFKLLIASVRFNKIPCSCSLKPPVRNDFVTLRDNRCFIKRYMEKYTH